MSSQKYLKYKNKYLRLKKQLGGFNQELYLRITNPANGIYENLGFDPNQLYGKNNTDLKDMVIKRIREIGTQFNPEDAANMDHRVACEEVKALMRSIYFRTMSTEDFTEYTR